MDVQCFHWILSLRNLRNVIQTLKKAAVRKNIKTSRLEMEIMRNLIIFFVLQQCNSAFMSLTVLFLFVSKYDLNTDQGLFAYKLCLCNTI